LISHMEYKEYMGSVAYSTEDAVLYGTVMGICDSISYHGRSIDEIQVAFHEAVDDYLRMCADEGLQPNFILPSGANSRFT